MQKLAGVAQAHEVCGSLTREACLLQRLPNTSQAYWDAWNRLQDKLGGKFYTLLEAVIQAMEQTPRCSSLVENLHSRLRNYFNAASSPGRRIPGLAPILPEPSALHA
jgi:hypothetical protein